MHSRAKLALAVLTSPGAAFEEILERRLLGTGLVIVAVAGALSCVRASLAASALGPVHYFALGRHNPLAWFGLFLLYALALQKLLKWIGTEIDYVRLLIIMGWSQVALLASQALVTIGGAAALSGAPAGTVLQFLDAVSQVLHIGYVALIGIGIHVATSAPMARGIMSYVVIWLAAWIAFAFTYTNSRLKLFATALPGVAIVAQQVAEADAVPWLAASVFGLILGLRQLGKELGWEGGRRTRLAATVGLIGAAVFGGYLYGFVKTDYYGRLIAAQRDYDLDKFDRAAFQLRSLIPASRYTAAGLTLDVADIYYLAGRSALSIRYYKRFEDMVRKAKLGKDEGERLARPLSSIGAVYDLDGKYDLATKQFDAAAKAWPEFRDPWVRMAITYDRMGNYKKAVETADHAIKKLGSGAAVGYIALAQAYARMGDAAKAKAAYEELKRIDDELAKRIGDKPGDWKDAVGKLTAKDLKLPLEKEVAPAPKKPARGAGRR